MAEVVVERPETIFIGTANQVAKGVEHVWRYKLTFVGAERMYVCMEPPSTTHAGDLMFIMEEVVEGNKWYVAYEGRPVPNAEGEQELEKRAAVFRTSASFWEDGVHEWETNNVRSRATYAEPAEEPQWRASDFIVCTRHEIVVVALQTLLHFWTPTAFWRGGLMHVVCVCVELQAFCIFGLNCLLARWHLQAQSCHGYYFCCVVWGKNRVCRAAFCVKLWMLGFGFDMSERMSEDMSESMSKDMSERMSEDMSERVSKDLSERMSKDMSERCQKECQEDMSETMSEDISEDMSERMSKDMSERTSEDCFQSVCEVESNGTHCRRWVVCLPLTWPDQADISPMDAAACLSSSRKEHRDQSPSH